MKNHFVNSVFLQEIFRFSLHFKTAAIPHSAPFSEKNTSEMSSRKRQIPLFALPGRLPIFVPYFLRHFDKIKYMRQFFEMVIRLHFSCQTRLSLSFFRRFSLFLRLIRHFSLFPVSFSRRLSFLSSACAALSVRKKGSVYPLPALLSARKALPSACKIRSAVRQTARPEMSAKKERGQSPCSFFLFSFLRERTVPCAA